MQKRRDRAKITFSFSRGGHWRRFTVAVREAIVRTSVLKDALSFFEDINSIIKSGLESAVARVKAQRKQ